ncbi:hypothetical protein AMTRI_Chr01g134400 [Amborella trichopoda]|uniref:proton pump-interactor 1 n=1 Tax=Amborella trichopoda TaxID=13333 RepID=UPI0005D36AAC|nr:proton pump-interactor 1 [Amborella trichopoda]|eukprot:XP_011628805.1 proton pump-interactor 1 [Amborella trichopoda]
MGVEILATQVPAEEGKEVENTLSHETEGGKPVQSSEAEPAMKFDVLDGSHGANGSIKGGAEGVGDISFPKDASDEWPETKVHTFYFIRFRSYEDPKLKIKIEQADKELQKKNQDRYQITEALKAKRAERVQVIEKLKPLTSQQKEYRKALDEKKKELEPLRAALGKLRNANNPNRERGMGLCSSERELNERIQSLQYCIQHESNTLVEEKQMLRDIKQLEGTREKVIAHEAMQTKIQESLGPEDEIQDHVKLLGGDLDGVRKEQQAIWSKIKLLEEDLKSIENEIGSLQEELALMSQKRDKAYESLVELRKGRENGNAPFYQYRSLITMVKDLAAKKDISALEELSHRETEKFMALWSSSKAVRDDYEKRILPSLDNRQMSRDGRMRNPDEKPLIAPEEPAPTESIAVSVKPNAKKPKEVNPPVQEPTIASKAQIDDSKRVAEVESKAKEISPHEVEDFYVPESHKEFSANVSIDPAKLKEMTREEEILKAKLAMERKKKAAEKAAAKAAIRAQKESEKKLKEREKKAKKKAGAFVPLNDTEEAEVEQTEVDAKPVQSETVASEKVEAPVTLKTKESKDTVRFRSRSKAQNPVPRGILKKKRSMNYWIWIAPGALLILVLLVLGYYHIL